MRLPTKYPTGPRQAGLHVSLQCPLCGRKTGKARVPELRLHLLAEHLRKVHGVKP